MEVANLESDSASNQDIPQFASADNEANEKENDSVKKEDLPGEDYPDKDDDNAKSSQEQPVKKKRRIEDNAELAKYWKALKENPEDFMQWTYLLQTAESSDDHDAVDEVFTAFLKKYPYCYGYWKKFADVQKRRNDLVAAEKVYMDGLSDIPLSIDLWTHYIGFTKIKLEDSDDYDDKIRDVFEKAVDAAGTDFQSDKLWELYIAWEKEKGNLIAMTEIYTRLLAIPTQLYSHHFESFCSHVNQNQPQDVVGIDELLVLRKQMLEEKEQKLIEMRNKPSLCEESQESGVDQSISENCNTNNESPDSSKPLKEVTSITEDNSADDSVKSEIIATPTTTEGDEKCNGKEAMEVLVDKEIQDDVSILREKIIKCRREIHIKNEEEIRKCWSYEEGIRRPYFHVKPLENVQLKNWIDYLEFAIKNNSHERVIVLFERCMIACALYEEMWLKYANYMEKFGHESVRRVFKKACHKHIPNKPAAHFAWAAYEEKHGYYEEALDILDNLESRIPGLAMAKLRRIGLERRRGNFDQVEKLYNDAIDDSSAEMKIFFSLKYARYLSKVIQAYKKAQEVLEEVLEIDAENHHVYLQLIDNEFLNNESQEVDVLKAFDKAIEGPLDISSRITFSQRKLEYLEDFGSRADRLPEAYHRHRLLLEESRDLALKEKLQETEFGDSRKKENQDYPDSSYSYYNSYNNWGPNYNYGYNY